jgi:hypothetical protein
VTLCIDRLAGISPDIRLDQDRFVDKYVDQRLATSMCRLVVAQVDDQAGSVPHRVDRVDLISLSDYT